MNYLHKTLYTESRQTVVPAVLICSGELKLRHTPSDRLITRHFQLSSSVTIFFSLTGIRTENKKTFTKWCKGTVKSTVSFNLR